MALTFEGQYLRLKITGNEESFPTLLDVSSFLYDVNLLYEFLRLSLDPSHIDFIFSPDAYTRRGRPLREYEQLHIQSLRVGSPIDFVAVVPVMASAVVAVAGLVAICLKIYNAPLNHRKLKAEVEKLERENRHESHEETLKAFEDLEGLDKKLGARESRYWVEGIAKRLTSSSVKIQLIEVEVVTFQEIEQQKNNKSTDNDKS